jgi:DNA-binding beta-propeller fold protein YncE
MLARHGVTLFTRVALLLVLTTGAGAQAVRPVAVIDIPGASLESFDISWVDATTQTYYLADRSNAGVDVIDAKAHTFVKRIGGFVGFRGKNDVSGPAGVVLVPERHELWVGDGDSTVKVVDLQAGTVVATISTGGSKRADELDYDPVDQLIVVTNPDDDPAFITFISTQTRTVLGTLAFPDATDGIEQPVWDPGTQRFYQAVPETKAHPGGAVAVVDPRARTVTALYPVTSCQPHGLAVGPTEELLLGCSAGKDARSIILNVRTGTVVSTLTEVGGSDQVWYNPGDQRYYLAARENPGGPVLGVIDARTHRWLTNIPTAKNAHSVAVNAVTNEAFVPLTPNPACAKGCVAVFRAGP